MSDRFFRRGGERAVAAGCVNHQRAAAVDVIGDRLGGGRRKCEVARAGQVGQRERGVDRCRVWIHGRPAQIDAAAIVEVGREASPPGRLGIPVAVEIKPRDFDSGFRRDLGIGAGKFVQALPAQAGEFVGRIYQNILHHLKLLGALLDGLALPVLGDVVGGDEQHQFAHAVAHAAQCDDLASGFRLKEFAGLEEVSRRQRAELIGGKQPPPQRLE